MTTLRDALRNVAGISLAAGEGSAQGDNLTIRGFTARNDLFIDGMRDFGSYYRDPFDMQEVEVLQGPSSVTFGRGSTGGVVNQASKTPGLIGIRLGRLRLGDRSYAPPHARYRSSRYRARFSRGVPPERDGRHERCRGPRYRRESPLRNRSVARAGPGHTDPLDVQLLSSERRRQSGLWHSMAVQRPGSGESRRILRLSERQLPANLRRHRHGQGRARLSSATSHCAIRSATPITSATC